MGKNGLKLTNLQDVIPGVTIKPAKVKNPNQSLPITCKVQKSLGGKKSKY